MWIYEPTEKEIDLSQPERTDLPLPMQESPAPELLLPAPEQPAESPHPVTMAVSDAPHRAAKQKIKTCPATRDCWLLAAAFLLGSMAAGLLQAVCDARQAEVLGYYLNAWRTLFAAKALPDAVLLFGAEYLTLGVLVSLFLLLGFSALGPLLIFGCMMFYGLGSGLLLVQLFGTGGWRIVFSVLLWTGIPAALAGGCLCLFGAAALQVSSRIRAYSFRGRAVGPAGPGIRALLGQYLLTMLLLLPLCGAAAGLSCLGSRF